MDRKCISSCLEPSTFLGHCGIMASLLRGSSFFMLEIRGRSVTISETRTDERLTCATTKMRYLVRSIIQNVNSLFIIPTSIQTENMSSALDVIKNFYEARAKGDISAIRSFIADDVRWVEPTVGDHMGELNGVNAVIDLIERALSTTKGTFSLEVSEGIEVNGHCSVVIKWSAEKSGTMIRGRELATYSIVGGKITFAQFLPENIKDDNAFWS